MPDGLTFDELNKLYDETANRRSMPYDQYFGEMDLSEEQIERRKQTAQEIERFMTSVLMAMFYQYQEGSYSYEEITAELTREYQGMLERMNVPFTAYFLQMHVQSMVADLIASTLNNPSLVYNYTNDRAMFIAENESNDIWNDSEYQDAILTGKTMKRWSAILDKRTRDTHREVNGAAIPIDEYFQVGEALLLYPKSDSSYPEEVVNCRCSVIYF